MNAFSCQKVGQIWQLETTFGSQVVLLLPLLALFPFFDCWEDWAEAVYMEHR